MTVRSSFLLVLLTSLAVGGCTVDTPAGDASIDTNRVPLVDTGPDTGTPTCDPGRVACGGVCTRLAADSMNCGSCGNACPTGTTCAVGECSCHAPMIACDGTCVDLQSDPEHCGDCATACDSTQICSMGECIVMCTAASHQVCVNTDATGARTQVCADLRNDDNNCGACNTRCTGTSTCVDRVCACPGGGISCGTGCIDPMTDPNNCGGCLNSCGPGGTCVGGACATCGTDLTRCGTPARCVNTMTSTLHCGMCSHACAGGATCNAGTCECPASTPTDCSGQCVDLETNPLNCHTCGNACPVGSDCVAGVCQCPGTETACGPACTDLMTDTHNCGSCGRACAPTSTCTAGNCICPGTQTDCNGVCVDTTTNVDNCGGCGQDCGPGGTCAGSVCTCASGLTLCGGSCVNLLSNSRNCNMCGNDCGRGMACHAGVCEPADSFRVLSLDTTGCQVVDHEAQSGDDHGGVAISPRQFFVQGDTSAIRMNASDLSSITALGVVRDGIVQNVDSEEVYLLLSATNTEQEWFGSDLTITQLGVLDPDTGALTSSRIPLTMPITVPGYDVAVMSGYGEALIGVPVTGGRDWYRIGLPDGEVTQLARTPDPSHSTCETWAFWGIAERFGGTHYALFVEGFDQISRLEIPDTGVSTAAATVHTTFTNLSDMCSITFSTSRNRWYFHHEGSSQFGGTSETAGYCPGTYDRP